MRILVVGAGGVGGYFGGRLVEAGRDVTFLVRPARAARLAASGLAIRSPAGDADLSPPSTVQAEQLAGRGPYDLAILSCKAYDLPGAIDALAPAVGPGTTVLPLLNGMKHLDALDARFGRDAVLGGLCLISSRLDEDGRIVHLSDVHRLTFGARTPAQAEAVRTVAEAFSGAKFEPVVSEDVTLAMWEKWTFLATLAGVTCLARAAIGDVARSGGTGLVASLLEECRAIAEANGHAPRADFLEMSRKRLTDPDSILTASMLDDLERGGATEADHILGDLLDRAPADPGPASLLRTALLAIHAQALRARREAKA